MFIKRKKFNIIIILCIRSNDYYSEYHSIMLFGFLVLNIIIQMCQLQYFVCHKKHAKLPTTIIFFVDPKHKNIVSYYDHESKL